MRTRNIKKQVWLNREEATLLKKKAKKVGLNELELVRNLITNFEPREKPDDRFYEVMNEMRAIGNNLNQIARKANSLNFVDYPLYKKEADKWNEFMLKVKREFLLPKPKEGNNG